LRGPENDKYTLLITAIMAFSVALTGKRRKAMNSMLYELFGSKSLIVFEGVSEWAPKLEARRTFDSREHLCLGKRLCVRMK
jgi:hypothetical protein